MFVCSWNCFFLILLLVFRLGVPTDFFGNRFKSFGEFQNRLDDEYYRRLGVPISASEKEIKSAYRKKAMIMHPDKGGKEDEFKQLVEAYEILSDPKKRKVYDQYGKAGLKGSTDFQDFSNMNPDFREFFRGFANFPIVYNIEVDLEDFFKGRTLTIVLQREKFVLEIEPGMSEGTEIRGQIVDHRGISRQLVLILQEKPHPSFQRKNADLLMECTISITEMLLGFERTVTHLDGSHFTIKSKEGEVIGPDDIMAIDQLGMPIYQSSSQKFKRNERGKLFIRFKVEIPRLLKLSDEQKLFLKKLFPEEQTTANSNHKFPARKGKEAIPSFTLSRSDIRKFGLSGRPLSNGKYNFEEFFF